MGFTAVVVIGGQVSAKLEFEFISSTEIPEILPEVADKNTDDDNEDSNLLKISVKWNQDQGEAARTGLS